MLRDYNQFLSSKVAIAQEGGFEVSADDINPILQPHQKLIIIWACRGGRRAIFAAFGLGKSVIQIEILRIVIARFGGRGLLVLPLGVRQEFRQDCELLVTGIHPRITDAQRAALRAWQEGHPERVPSLTFIRSILEAGEAGLYMTNYETVREGRLIPDCSLSRLSTRLPAFVGSEGQRRSANSCDCLMASGSSSLPRRRLPQTSTLNCWPIPLSSK